MTPYLKYLHIDYDCIMHACSTYYTIINLYVNIILKINIR